MRLQSFFQRLRLVRESVSRCLSFAALEYWKLVRSPSARRRGGGLSITTEAAESRLVLSASPLSPAFDETETFPEIDADPVTWEQFPSDGYEVDDLREDLPLQDFPDGFSGIDLLFPEWPGAFPDHEATQTEWPDDVIGTPGFVITEPGNHLIDFDDALDGTEEQISDGLEPSDPDDLLFPIGGTDESEGSELHLADSLQGLLSHLVEDLEFAGSLIGRAESGEFVTVFPVFSEETGGATLETFPNQIAPLEVLISVAPAKPLDPALSTAENTLDLHFDDLGDWVSGTLEEKSYQLELAVVNAISAVLPEVPFVLSSSIGSESADEFIIRRFIVVDGFGYPMQRRLREGGPVLTGEDEPILDDPDFGGDPVLGEEPPEPATEPDATTGKISEEPPQETPASTADAGLINSMNMIHQGHSISLRGANGANRLVTLAPEPENWNQTGWIQHRSASSLIVHQAFATSLITAASQHGRMMFPDWGGFYVAWASREAGRPGPEFTAAARSSADPADPVQYSADNSLAHQRINGGAKFSPPGGLVQSPVTTELATSVLPTRLQLIPLSGQVQLRRYRAGHRLATAAEYVEIPLRDFVALAQERLENDAPSQLRYVLNPRAPPRGPPSSECLIETFAENDLLERLRYSIAPRGPSLADSSSLSPGSVFFSGPRVSPVSLAI